MNLMSLISHSIVEQRKERGPYALRRDLLTREDLKRLSDRSHVVRIINLVDAEGERISKIRRSRLRQRALTLFLRQNLSMIALFQCQLLGDVGDFQDIEQGDMLLEKAMRTLVEPWIGMLNVACFRNRSLLRHAVKGAAEFFLDLCSRSLREYDTLLLRQPR